MTMHRRSTVCRVSAVLAVGVARVPVRVTSGITVAVCASDAPWSVSEALLLRDFAKKWHTHVLGLRSDGDATADRDRTRARVGLRPVRVSSLGHV
jgi:hypothetical protein